MCGIIAYTGTRQAAPLLLSGLKRLEYRGYDSAGIATTQNSALHLRKEKGKVSALSALLDSHPLDGTTGIAHTRWATHGEAEQRNAHPHQNGDVAIVHNGIIENYQELKDALLAQGMSFTSDTDSEVVACWLNQQLSLGHAMLESIAKLGDLLEGAYAIVACHSDTPDTLYFIKSGSPLVIGVGDEEGEHWIGSDTLTLAGCASKGSFIADGHYGIVQPDHFTLYTPKHQQIKPPITSFHTDAASHDKQGYAHFMLKEIYEQPEVIRRTLTHYYDSEQGHFAFEGLHLELGSIEELTIVACGTSYYAAQVASYWCEHLAHIPVRIDVASEFRYRHPVIKPGHVTLFISQSGETADTLAAMRYAKACGAHTIAVVNVISSTMAREADSVIQTLAGAEIGVASTKAFIAQLTILSALTLTLAKNRQTIDAPTYHSLAHGLSDIADKIEQVLSAAESYDQLAPALMYARDMLFIGRGTSYPLANEGALKMKEISYIHAEGYAAGELKHGPIALVDDGVPIIVIAPDDDLFDKSASNLEETAARKGNIVLISSEEKIAHFRGNVTHHAALPACDSFHAPLLYAVPLQLLAYYVALHKGADIDQPRNLAKSVTVE